MAHPPYILTVTPEGANVRIYYKLPEGEPMMNEGTIMLKSMMRAWAITLPDGTLDAKTDPTASEARFAVPAERADDAVKEVRKWIDQSRLETLEDPPRAYPRTVCGIDLDEYETAHIMEAMKTGELFIELHRPAGSRVPEAWKLWCERQGIPHRVREERP